jgi:hypothetical protein
MTQTDAVRRSRRWAFLAAVALAVVHPGCGGNNSNNGPETFQDSATLSVLQPFGLVFTAQRNGTVDANVNWNDSNNDIDIYATAGTCASFDVLLAGGCSVITLSESGSAKPEVLSFNVTNGTIYTVWALNLGPGTDTVTIHLTAH